ncbi:MAG: hypothetical protein ACK55I_32300, partial [bacterium]
MRLIGLRRLQRKFITESPKRTHGRELPPRAFKELQHGLARARKLQFGLDLLIDVMIVAQGPKGIGHRTRTPEVVRMVSEI